MPHDAGADVPGGLHAPVREQLPQAVLQAGDRLGKLGTQLAVLGEVGHAGIQHLFAVEKNFAIGPIASYLHRDRNGYDPGTLQFVPAKDRTAAGVLARYAVNDQITLNFRGEHVWTRENERIAPNGQQFSVLANGLVAALAVPVVSSTGWVVVAGANVKF